LFDGVAAIQRIIITADPVLQTHFPIQNTKTFPDDFDLSIDAVLPTAATTVTLYGQTASAAHYIKVLSTGFASINIDSSIVTSTVLATKDNKQRRYGVKLVGNDFIFTEEGVTIDTVTDAVAAAKSLIINVIAQSNGADFFDGTLSDPLLTDLTTPSNSESWAINRALPATTEQSSSGNNILTYNNAIASTRELFTFINGEWESITNVWTVGDAVFTGAENVFVIVLTDTDALVIGRTYRASWAANITQGNAFLENWNAGGTIDVALTASVTRAATGVSPRFQTRGTVPTVGTVSNIEFIRIIEVA
jgi:hypothetical protein